MFERIKGFFKKATVAASGVAVSATSALAEPAGFTVTPPEIDYALLGTMTASILGGLAAVWLIRKAIKLMNRS